ncbi:MAG TPA: tetratricopeptide repeat protein [Pirellulales bacterium]|jgi:tetratricopeptide (TPR) repeat protein|nr:tetratricopeptide repeat protein [Pirellulales bacterium]
MSFRFALARSGCWTAAFLGVTLFCVCVARAENEGQDELDKASDKKLAADSVEDLGQVIDLCESALKKGLDAGNSQFANNLLTGTLLERANVLLKNIVQQKPAGWQQLRILALADLGKALKISPQMAPAQLMIARLQQLPGGDRAAAQKAAEAALDLSKDKQEDRVAALVLLADLTDEPEKKLDYYAQALKIAPNNQEALRRRGMFLLTSGKMQEAAADLDAAAKADPEDPVLQEVRGLAWFALKNNDEAIAAFSDEIKLRPESGLPYLHRAQVYAVAKKTKEALNDIDQALKLEPDKIQQVAQALLLKSQIHQEADDRKAARADLDEALKDVPGWAPALEARAVLSAAEEDYGQAIRDSQELLKASPRNAQLLDQLGMLYQANKQPRKAIATYSDVLTANPESMSALIGRADAYLNLGKHTDAVADYEAALKIKPDDLGVLNNLAWVLATSPDDKVRNSKRSIELSTQAAKQSDYKQAYILSTLAAGYAESGDFDTAKQWSQKAVDLGSDKPDVNVQLKKELSSYENKKPWREKQVIEEKDDSRSASQPDAKSSAKKLPGPPPVGGDNSAANEAPTKKE